MFLFCFVHVLLIKRQTTLLIPFCSSAREISISKHCTKHYIMFFTRLYCSYIVGGFNFGILFLFLQHCVHVVYINGIFNAAGEH